VAEAVPDRDPAVAEIDHRGRLRFQPSFFSFLPKERPGVPFSTTMQEMPCGPHAGRSMHVDIARAPPEMNALLR